MMAAEGNNEHNAAGDSGTHQTNESNDVFSRLATQTAARRGKRGASGVEISPQRTSDLQRR